MAVKVSQQHDHAVMTDNVKLISMIFLSISLFFILLFFGCYSAFMSDDGFDRIGSRYEHFLIFIVTMTTLTLAIICMEFYHIRRRALAMFKYAVIVANAVIISFLIKELSKGYEDLVQVGQTGATMYTFGGLSVGFAGVGTLLAILHNFHGIMGLV
tara:strand:+ start:8110 stop:8577 length:468 start_codon:yes stop_codon:yes gene_type:complete